MAFRDNLQHLRAVHNMTQEQLAMLLGVSRQSVTKWEAEKSYPEMDKLLKMCQIFDCSLDDLVQGDLTDRVIERPDASVPSGPPTDVCGYDDHQRMMARKIPTGTAIILAMVGISFLFEGAALWYAQWQGWFVRSHHPHGRSARAGLGRSCRYGAYCLREGASVR